MAARPCHVLFLCTGNSARSIMAEAILNRLGEGRIRAYSAGSHPQGRVHPMALEVLEARGHDTSALRSKGLREFEGDDAPQLDFVFTVCDNAANEACPIWPGHPITAHWGMPDPAAFEGTEEEQRRAFSRTYEELHHRIERFTRLPLESPDRSALAAELEAIGKTAEPTTGDDD